MKGYTSVPPIDSPNRSFGGLSLSMAFHAALFCALVVMKNAPPSVLNPPSFVEVATIAVIPALKEPPSPPQVRPLPLPEPKKPEQPKPKAKPPTPKFKPIAQPRVLSDKPTAVEQVTAITAPPVAQKNTPPSAPEAIVEADYRSPTLKNPPTVYPITALKAGIGGIVKLRVQVFANGLPGQIQIEQSSGYSMLDESAAKQVINWRFIPARRGGLAIDSWVIVPVKFLISR